MSSEAQATIWLGVMIAIIVAVVWSIDPHVDHDKGKAVLEAQGMTSVQIGGYSWLGCGEKDLQRTKFSAVGTNGKPVSGSLCGNWVKGITVRFD